MSTRSRACTGGRFSIPAAIPPWKPTSFSKTARAAAPRCPPAHPPASTKRSNCATAISRATSAKACCKAVENVNSAIAARRHAASTPPTRARSTAA